MNEIRTETAKEKSNKNFFEHRRIKKLKFILNNIDTERLFNGIDMLSSDWLGKYVNEDVLDNIDFGDGNGNLVRNRKKTYIPYDFTTTKFDSNGLYTNVKIETKSSCWTYRYMSGYWYKTFGFNIKNNIEADNFILIAYDNIINLNILYIWKFKKDDVVYDKKPINTILKLCINDSVVVYDKLKQYEINGNIKKELQNKINEKKKTYLPKLCEMINNKIELHNKSNKTKQINFDLSELNRSCVYAI